ncbi:MAG: DegT/DnrJ/EryC1/StrS family aminotransferase [Vicinamibacterales bacterium]
MNWRVPLFQLAFGVEEREAALRVLESQWLSQGPETAGFEEAFAKYTGVKHAFAVANCTAALHLAYVVAGVGPDTEVICPSLTFVATANAAYAAGGSARLADITSLDDWTVSPASVEALITPKTRAISVMHYAGYPCDMAAFRALADRHGLMLVEDCAHAIGTWYDGRHVGGWGDIGCFSFFSNKNLSTGEGGMLTTNRDDLAEKIRLMRSHGMTSLSFDRHKGHAFSYDVQAKGFNFRMTEITAAIGAEQLKKLPANNRRREALTATYRQALRDSGLTLPFASCRHQAAYHILPALLPEHADRRAFMQGLKDAQVQSSIHYPPVHSFTAYAGHARTSLALTDIVASREVTLPLYPTMTDEDVAYVARTVVETVGTRV